MKQLTQLSVLLFFSAVTTLQAQSYYETVINSSLLAHISANHVTREASLANFNSIFKKQKEFYEESNKKIVQVVAIHEKIYQNLYNINSLFGQSKQINFIDDLQMVTRFLAGIVLSYGAINQMEHAERQILLDYALSEVDRLYNDSYATLTVIRETSYTIQRRRSLFQYYIDRDKELAQDILKNVKSLGI